MNQMKLLTLMLGLTALVTGAYFVKKGDTLWDLSGTFFNDPFAWPDLWENNRHIEDPHWIYPGDSIYIGEHDTASVKESKPVNKNLCTSTIPDSTLPKTVVPVGCDESDSRGDQFENMLGNLRSKSKISKKKKASDEYFYQQRPESKIFKGITKSYLQIFILLMNLKMIPAGFLFNLEKSIPLFSIYLKKKLL
jgi:hypothetical protein